MPWAGLWRAKDDTLAERAGGGHPLLPQPRLDALCVEAVAARQDGDAAAVLVALQTY